MSQQVIPPEMPVNVIVSVGNLQIILQGLGQLPYNVVSNLIQDLRNQGDKACMEFLKMVAEADKPKEELSSPTGISSQALASVDAAPIG